MSVRCVGRSVGVLVCWNVCQIKISYKDGKLHFHFSFRSNCFFPLAWHAERCHWNEWYQGQGFANLCVSLANFCALCKFSGDSARGMIREGDSVGREKERVSLNPCPNRRCEFMKERFKETINRRTDRQSYRALKYCYVWILGWREYWDMVTLSKLR